MLLLDLIIGLLVAITTNIDPHTDPTEPDYDCRPTVSVGHVPGHMTRVWILRCD